MHPKAEWRLLLWRNNLQDTQIITDTRRISTYVSVWCKVYTSSKINKIPSGYQPRQLVKNYRRFRDHLCPYHQGRSGHSHIITLTKRTEIFYESPLTLNYLTQLITREVCVKTSALLLWRNIYSWSEICSQWTNG